MHTFRLKCDIIICVILIFVEQKYKNAILRLEVEEENEHAVYVYKKRGFEVFPYMEMKKETKFSS